MSDSVRPHGLQPTRLPHPWDSPGKNTGVGCHCLLQCMKVKSESEDAQSCLTLSDPMDCSQPGSSVHGISRQEYWSGVPLPSPTYTHYLQLFLAALRYPSSSVRVLHRELFHSCSLILTAFHYGLFFVLWPSWPLFLWCLIFLLQ